MGKITLSAEQSALYQCIAQTAKLHGDIIDALVNYYTEEQTERNKIGQDVFLHLVKVRQGLFAILSDMITDDIYTLENKPNG